MTEPTVVVLLHGLGGNRHVWDDVAELLSAQGTSVLAPDFRGHGRAPWTGHYSFGAMAADIAQLLHRDYSGAPYAVVGHSMGGAVGLTLASGWFGPVPASVATIGVKLRWSGEELGRLDDLASRPPREFPDRDGAVEWFMKLAGLHGVIDADDDRIEMAVEAGVMRTDTELHVTEDGEPMRIDPPGPAARWCVAQDPATVEVGAPDMAGLLAAAKCPVVMALGEHDPLVVPAHHMDLASAAATNPHAAAVTAPHVFVGLGHNAMTENPRAVADWLTTLPGFAGTR